MHTAIVGGGAAGFFLAINLRELCPGMQVTILERSQHLLQKVKVSGGGRCNCTNTFEDVGDLSAVYPRGHRLMRRLLKSFSQRDAFAWFQNRGVRLTIQEDHCVFPATQDSQTIIDCFLTAARRLQVNIRTSQRVDDLTGLDTYDYVVITTGGLRADTPLAHSLAAAGHTILPPVPSLFTFSIADPALRALMGTVVPDATALLPGTSFRACGPLLITHWGMSGPAILKLSSYAARHLAEAGYQAPLAVNWVSADEERVRQELQRLIAQSPQRLTTSLRPFDLPARLWTFIAARSGVGSRRLAELSKRDINATSTASPPASPPTPTPSPPVRPSRTSSSPAEASPSPP